MSWYDEAPAAGGLFDLLAEEDAMTGNSGDDDLEMNNRNRNRKKEKGEVITLTVTLTLTLNPNPEWFFGFSYFLGGPIKKNKSTSCFLGGIVGIRPSVASPNGTSPPPPCPGFSVFLCRVSFHS